MEKSGISNKIEGRILGKQIVASLKRTEFFLGFGEHFLIAYDFEGDGFGEMLGGFVIRGKVLETHITEAGLGGVLYGIRWECIGYGSG